MGLDVVDHTEAARAYANKWPQYLNSVRRSGVIRLLRNVGKQGGPNWCRRGDVTIGYLDDEDRLHLFSSKVGWCIVTKPSGKFEFVGGIT